MFKNNFVVAIKNRGNVLREREGVVSLPFGSDYSVLLKNLDSRKAVVKITIDGQDVLDGNSVIVKQNSPLELKGFMKGSTVKNRFRFIEKTEQISKFRGDRADDGIIRVEFKYEKDIPHHIWGPSTYPTWPTPVWPIIYDHNPVVYSSNAINCPYDDQGSVTYRSATLKSSSNMNYNVSNSVFCAQNLDGITVKGAETKQDFVVGEVNQLESFSTVITLRLTGVTKNAIIVNKPLVTKERIQCSTCGIRSKSHAKFCINCGTFLEHK